jgi:hypothetical protein
VQQHQHQHLAVKKKKKKKKLNSYVHELPLLFLKSKEQLLLAGAC